ncbi:TlpA family protein disulfide reductase [Echinicola soli]|nr:TlpA disulfide reductase family protein [Echinicola soli]
MKSKLFLLPLLALLACGKAEKNPAVQLTLDLENIDDASVLNIYDLSAQLGGDLLSPISSIAADSTGTFQVTMDSIQPGFYGLEVNDQGFTTLYLYDGVNMAVKGDPKKPKQLAYSGEGAGEAIFYRDFAALSTQSLGVFVEEDESNFVRKLDSAYQAGMNEINEADSLNNTFITNEKALLTARRALYTSYYPRGRQRLMQSAEEILLPDSVKAYKTMAITLANEGLLIPEYRRVMDNLHQTAFNKVMNEYSEAHPDENWGMTEYIEMRRDYILEDEDEALKDYLLAKLALDAISYYGDEAAALAYDTYLEKYPDSPFKEYLEAVNKKWEKLAKGKPAIEVEGSAPDGSKVKLSDFEGKVIYLDTWATWCGPCRGEFPAAKKLKEEYKDQKDVVFMYASIDSDKEAWEKYLKEDPDFKGIHLYVDGAWQSDLCHDYMINAIPRYILIDKNGNIANVKAPRPSSGETIRNEINALL